MLNLAWTCFAPLVNVAKGMYAEKGGGQVTKKARTKKTYYYKT